MANYNPYYRLEFFDHPYKRYYRVDIEKLDYTGEVQEEFVGTGSPLFIGLQNPGDNKWDTIKGTEIILGIHSKSRFDYTVISDGTDREYLMKVYRAPSENDPLVLMHIGFVLPELFNEAYVKAPYEVSITASSLGILGTERYQPGDAYGEYDYSEYQASGEFYTGKITLMQILTRCLNKLGYGIDIWDSLNTFEKRILTFESSPLKHIKKDQEDFLIEEDGEVQAKTCLQVIEDILKPFVCNFFMDAGYWAIIPMELRATNRPVRVYDNNGNLKDSGTFNPLEVRPIWIDKGQNLENHPIIKRVDSLYEHGLPQNAIKNHLFEEDFIEVTKGGDASIEYPTFWELNNAGDFGSNATLQSIKATSIASKDRTEKVVLIDDRSRTGEPIVRTLFSRPKSAVFMNSYFITDGAYIEQQGDRIIEEGETIDLTVDYAPDTRQIAGTIEHTDTKVPDDNITHKFQYRVGSKYVKADGSWSDTPVDIELEDLGDAESGYTVHTRLGVAEGFRTFEIVTDPVPESGFLRSRIYKPVSENEGTSNGDTYATVAYSVFSAVLFPDGSPPEEDTNFFSDRQVDVYSDSIKYPINSGDGPTNLHLSSFLLDTEYGNDLKTENWVRGNWEGGLSTIIINTLNLEGWTKSQLIRGTQRVRRLFDRWFVELQKGEKKGYTVLAGTYDCRMAHFNGECIQVLNSEVDLWGVDDEELKPGPNFQVLSSLNPPPTDNDTVYGIAFADGEFRIVTMDYNEDGFVIGSQSSNAVPDEHVIEQISTNAGHQDFAILENGAVGICGYGSITTDDFSFVMYDSDWNLIASLSFEGHDRQNSLKKVVQRDEDDNLYVCIPRDQFFAFVYKFDNQGNQLWQSDNGVSQTNTADYDMVINANSLAVLSDRSSGRSLTIINKETGERIFRQYPLTGSSASYMDLAAIDGYYVWWDLETNDLRVYDEAGALDKVINTVSLVGHECETSSLSVMEAAGATEVFLITLDPDDTEQIIYLNKIDIINETLVWQGSVDIDDSTGIAIGSPEYITLRDDGIVIIGHDQGGTFDSPGITAWDNETGAFLFDCKVTIGFDLSQAKFFKVPPTNWFLASFVGVTIGTPDIENVTLTATPQTETVPFNSLIEFGADNTGDAAVSLNLVVDGVIEFSLEIPAGGSANHAISKGFEFPGSYPVSFGGEALTITANGGTVTGDYEGHIEVTGPATNDTEAVQPDATIDVLNTPSQQSDPCGTGGTEFNVEWKLTDYCMILPSGPDTNTVAQAVSGSISSTVTGLGSAYSGLSPSGFPRIRVYSETYGTADNGERVAFGVPSVLEQDGGVFNRYEIFLTGGVDEYIVSEQIDILIGGAVFATTSAITALETADSIAQKIYDACVAVGSGTYTFAKNGTRIDVGSTSGAENLELDIKNAGFTYTVQNIVEV